MVDAARATAHPGLQFTVARSEKFAARRLRSTRRSACVRSTTPPTAWGFFARFRGIRRRRCVFDFRPRDHPVAEVVADLRAAGFGELELRPFFLPQLRRRPERRCCPSSMGSSGLGRQRSTRPALYGRVFCAAVPDDVIGLLDKFDGLAPGFSEREYAEPERYAARRAEVALQRRGRCFQPGRDGARSRLRRRAHGPAARLTGTALPRRGWQRRNDRRSRSSLRQHCHLRGRVDRRVRATGAGRSDALSASDLLPGRPPACVSSRCGLHEGEVRLRFRPASGRSPRRDRRPPRMWFRPDRAAAVLSAAERVAARAGSRSSRDALEHAGPLARAALRVRGIWFCAASSTAWTA